MKKLIFEKPGVEWIDGLPLGNGRMGFMAYGNPFEECFTFNADSLFRNNNKKEIKTANSISKVRELILSGKAVEADRLYLELLKDYPIDCNSYQPFMDIHINALKKSLTSEYMRSLDLENGVGEILYTADDTNVNWCFFASNPDDVLVISRKSDKAQNVSLKIMRQHDSDCKYSVEWQGDLALFSAKFLEGVYFQAAIKVITDGNLKFECGETVIDNCTKIQLRIVLKTSFDNIDLEDRANKMDDKPYFELLDAHKKDFYALSNRMELKLSDDTRNSEELYSAVEKGELPPKLYEQLFAFSRYLTISSSRRGSMPMNLQGLWNIDLIPNWNCGYTVDMNLQMAYWMTEAANLSECHEALFDWIDSNLSLMEKQSKQIFGAENAAYIPQFTDMQMTPTCWREFSAFQVLWSGGAAWLASHYYKHWIYTGDDDFAKNRAFPFMKRCMNLYIHLLFENESGRLVLAPSTNPENWANDGGQLVNTATMDISLINELSHNLLHMNSVLQLNDPLASKWEEIKTKLVSYPIDENGLLREWVDEREPIDPYHRHLSHVYGLYPSHLFEGDERLTSAAIKALDKRIEGGYMRSAVWSFAWYACLFARLGDAEKTYEFFGHIVKCGLLPNMLTAYTDWRENTKYSHFEEGKIFQIDAMMGFGAAICEALVGEKNGVVHILPALPNEWKAKGSVRGIRISGGIELDFIWENGKVIKIEAFSKTEKEIAIKLPGTEILKIRTK